MRTPSLWARLLGVERTVVEKVELDADGSLVVSVRPWRAEQRRCPVCRRRCSGYDAGDGRRRWRALDLGTTLAYLEAAAPRVSCRKHGVVVAAVPWARQGSGFTRAFEDQTSWLVSNCAQSVVAELMRVAWRTVGRIISRVVEDASNEVDRLANLNRIGIDEISCRRGHRYLVVVIDHDSGRLVWAGEGRSAKTVRRFFEQVGPERCAQITHVSCDAADWIIDVAEEWCPNAIICLDAFHVVSWATKALDEVRREVWNAARRAGMEGEAKALKDARWALWKNPGKLTKDQKAKLAEIARTNKPLNRAYLLKEQFRQVFRLPLEKALVMLKGWIAWARRCRLQPFVKLARTITYYQADIEAALAQELSNARTEAMNTRIRLIARRAFGFHSAEALIALSELSLGGLCPPLPGRA